MKIKASDAPSNGVREIEIKGPTELSVDLVRVGRLSKRFTAAANGHSSTEIALAFVQLIMAQTRRAVLEDMSPKAQT